MPPKFDSEREMKFDTGRRSRSKIQTVKVTSQEFSNLDDFLYHCESTEPQGRWTRNPASVRSSGDDWYGFDGKRSAPCTLDQAVQFGRFGWSPGRDMIREVLLNSSVSGEIDKDIWKNDFVGSRPNIGRYLKGLPNSMSRYKKIPVTAPVIKIKASVQVSCAVDPEEFATHGAAMASLIDSIESSGVSVELCVVYDMWIRRTSWYSIVEVPVKRAGQPMNIDEIGFTMIHPAFCRRLMFRWYETDDRFYPHISSGYGYMPSAAEIRKFHTEQDTFLIEPTESYSGMSFDARLNKMKAQYEKFCEQNNF